MKICFFIDDITRDGGTERCTVVLANLLAMDNQRKITILSINASKGKSKYEISSDVEVKMFNQEKIDNSVCRKLKTFECLKREIKDALYDIIVVVDTYKSLCFIPFVPLLKIKGIKLISWEHFNYNFGKKYSGRWWGRRVALAISDAVVVLSDVDYATWNQKAGHSEKLKRIYNFSFFDFGKPIFTAERTTVLAVGRLEKQKGFDYLLDIWKKIEDREELIDWNLMIIGSGSLETELHKKAVNLGLKRVEWKRFTSQIDECYRRASIYVMSSRFEGFALVLLEARAFGLPIVSFDIENGPSEIIQQDVNGFLIPAFDTEEFAQKLGLLMKDTLLREEFTKASQNNMECFSKDEIVKQWIQLFEEI